MQRKKSNYSPEFRVEAVRLVLEKKLNSIQSQSQPKDI